METKVTSQEIEFNITKALIIIEKDKDLDEMFRAKFSTDYKLAHAFINSGEGLKPKAEKYIKDLFEKVILERSTLKEAYLKLGDVPSIEHSVEVTKEETEEKPNKKKRWGLRAIADDIASNFGGKAKQIHKTANKVQNLKKIFTRLEMRTFNERFGKQTLTDAQLRELGGAIDTFEKKVQSILNPKK